jgi:hypothetical protein
LSRTIFAAVLGEQGATVYVACGSSKFACTTAMNAAPRENWRVNGTLNGSAIVVKSNRPCLDWLHTGDSTHQLDLTSLDLMQELPLSHSGRCYE